jgi:hypothetical protein
LAVVTGTSYSFTATRDLKPDHVPLILPVLEELVDGTHFFTGAARGGDTFIARALTELYPRAHHTLVVPAAPHNEELVDGWMPSARRHIHVMPPCPDVALAYRQRNGVLNAKGRIVGFPLREEHRDIRSGTWMTIRMARKRGTLHRVLVLEPEDEFGEHGTSPRQAPARGKNRGPLL